MIKKIALAALVTVALSACSNDDEVINADVSISSDNYLDVVSSLYDGDVKPSIIDSSVSGSLVTLFLSNGSTIMFASDDSEHVILHTRTGPNILNIKTMTNHTELVRERQVKDLTENFEPMYVSEQSGDLKGVVKVAEDPQCHYCKLFLKNEVPKLNAAGYLVEHYPLAVFPGSETMMKLSACAVDPASTYKQLSASSKELQKEIKTAMTEALIDPSDIDADNKAMTYLANKFVEESDIKMKEKCDYPVSAVTFGFRSLGFSGTPAIIMPDGKISRGMVPAERIIGD
tara:strand:- start:3099 stop:3959 length:861 start_codon:yes stop_codon:yes gene_type:complete